MVIVYATLIINGRKTFSQVPTSLQPTVKDYLLSMGLDENGFPVEE